MNAEKEECFWKTRPAASAHQEAWLRAVCSSYCQHRVGCTQWRNEQKSGEHSLPGNPPRRGGPKPVSHRDSTSPLSHYKPTLTLITQQTRASGHLLKS